MTLIIQLILQELVKQCEAVTVLNPAGMASIRMLCSCDPDGPTHIVIKCKLLITGIVLLWYYYLRVFGKSTI